MQSIYFTGPQVFQVTADAKLGQVLQRLRMAAVLEESQDVFAQEHAIEHGRKFAFLPHHDELSVLNAH